MTRTADALGLHLREIALVPLLTAPEEIELARRIAAGDVAARDRMIRSNLRLVVRIARGHAHRGMPLEDAIGHGHIGLAIAVDRFDPGRGVRFSTYASYWIEQAISRAILNESNMVRVPAYLWHLTAKVRSGVRDRAALRPKQARCVAAAERVLYGTVAGTADDGAPGIDDLSDPADPMPALLAAEDAAWVAFALGCLDDREREVIRLRFGLGGGAGLTLKAVGERLGCTREWVRRIQERAIGKLRERCEAEVF